MSNLYITGDTHGTIDSWKLQNKRFPQQKYMTKDDIVCIAGDCGAVWDGDNRDQQAHIELGSHKFQTVSIKGNHEDHDILQTLPQQERYGNPVRVVDYCDIPAQYQQQWSPIYHLQCGYVYTLAGHTVFTFGGAESVDKIERLKHFPSYWWPQEMPSYADYERGLETLDRVNWTVDYVVTHTAPGQLLHYLKKEGDSAKYDVTNQLTEYFDMIFEKLQYKWWFCGHYHRDLVLSDHRFVYIYSNIYQCVDSDIQLVIKNDSCK